MNTMSSIHTVEYYSALKRKEILTTWMNFEDTMLSKRSQIQKNTHCLIPLTRGPRGVRSTETGSIWWGQGQGEETGKVAVVKVLVAQLCPTLCNPVDCSLAGSSVHGILQARILGWVAVPFLT